MQATEGVLRPATQSLLIPQESLTQTAPLPGWFAIAALSCHNSRLRIQQQAGEAASARRS